MAKASTRDQILTALREDWPYWSTNCAQIVNMAQQVVPLEPKPAQLRVWEAIKAQQAAGKPVRLLVPKARKEGVSTMAISLLVQRATQMPNYNAMSIAQDKNTAGELMALAEFIYNHLPDSEDWPIKPQIGSRARRKQLEFSEPSRHSQTSGDMGLNSRISVDTAREFESGRGFTLHALHGSEVGFWPDIKRKLTSLLNAMPDDPATIALFESSANGHNHWRTLCMDALDGLNDFALVFLPWFEEPAYQIPFFDAAEREAFEQSVGTGPYGEEEPELVEVFGCTLEQLKWRRWAIANRCQGDMRIFWQEYPSTLEQSFLSSGSHVFNQALVAKVQRQLEVVPAPEMGQMEHQSVRAYRSPFGLVEIPQDPVWKPGEGPWKIWTPPTEDGQYVIGADPAGEGQLDADERAMHAAVVLDHRLRTQVAEIEWQGDPDEFGDMLFLACLYFNRATLAVETTGNWGAPILRRIKRDYKYQFVYKRKRLVDGAESADEVLGFDTNRTTKGFLVNDGREMLREGTHGLCSRQIARQMTTYVRDAKSKFGPSPGERADLLMAFLIAHFAANETPIRHTVNGGGVISTTTRGVLNPTTGW